jgi:hypothetical protein
MPLSFARRFSQTWSISRIPSLKSNTVLNSNIHDCGLTLEIFDVMTSLESSFYSFNVMLSYSVI